MNPTPAPTPEPILSLSVGAVVAGLLLFVLVLALTGLLLTRRQRKASQEATGLDDVPWLTTLLDGLPQAALVVDPDGQPVVWNARTTHALSPKGEVIELPLPLVALVGRALDTGTAETTEISAPESPYRRLRVTASPLDSLGALVLLQNPSRGSRSAESYRRLTSAVAHELRTPLTAILGHADILDSCHPAEDEALWRRSRDFIAREARRLARLVEDLLTLSRLDLTPLQRRPVNLQAVAEEAISALFQEAEVRGVQISLNSPPNLPRVLGDRDRLGQVLVNLLDNAVKYSPAGGQACIRLTPGDGFVEVEVQDNGAGISPQDLPFIFDSLYRGTLVRDIPGSGLGLSIVRTILEQHGTTVNVQSVPNHGTTFHFRLPCA